MENYEKIINEVLEYYHISKMGELRTKGFDEIVKNKFNMSDEEITFLWDEYIKIYSYAEEWCFKGAKEKIDKDVIEKEVGAKYPFLKKTILKHILYKAWVATLM